jgi:uncharacterized spore protein YtfJ
MVNMPETLINTLLDRFKTIAKTETIIGKEFQVGDFTLIPISKVSLGIVAGGGSGGTKIESKGEGGLGGGGIKIEPIAVIVIKDGEISFHGIKKGNPIETLFEKIPEIADRIRKKGVDKSEKMRGL